MNIVLFGDSHLGRFGKRYIDQLEALVKDSVVYNCSAGGLTSSDGVRRVDFIAGLKPDIVIFSFGGNDVAPWKNIVPKPVFIDNMRTIFEAFPHSAKIIFTSPDVAVADPGQTREYNNSIHEYRHALTKICDELGVAIVDGNMVIRPQGGDYHEEDGVHMNDIAYLDVVNAFAKTINSF
jgi:lysophospholipase L1-like esterase